MNAACECKGAGTCLVCVVSRVRAAHRDAPRHTTSRAGVEPFLIESNDDGSVYIVAQKTRVFLAYEDIPVAIAALAVHLAQHGAAS